MKTIAKEIAQASDMTQVAVAISSMWILCAVMIILE